MSKSSAVRKMPPSRAPFTPKYGKCGEPENNYFPCSHELPRALNEGKITGDGQLRVMLNLIAMQHDTFAGALPEVVISATELAKLIRLSVTTAQQATTELATRCGNADPEWVKGHGKCRKGECTCPKMLTVTKRGNVNAYCVNLANFALAPRYVAPEPRAIREPKTETAKVYQAGLVEQKAKRTQDKQVSDFQAPYKFNSLAPGHRLLLPFVVTADSKLILVNDATDAIILAGDITFEDGDLIARIVPASVVTKSGKVYQAGLVEQKAKSGDSKRLRDFRPAIAEILAREWEGAPLTPLYLKQITDELQPEVTVDEYVEYAEAELARPEKRKRNAKGESVTTHRSGILLGFARQLSESRNSKAAARADWESAHPGACWNCKGSRSVMHQGREMYCPECEGTGQRAQAKTGASHA